MELRGRIAAACVRCDRDADDIIVVAVTKTHPVACIRMAVASGLHHIGESRVQEAEAKIREAGPIARYHMIGHLQTNKVRKAVEVFDVIQSVDSIKLAQEIDHHAGQLGRTIECLVEVNCSGEKAKYGVAPSDCLDTLRAIIRLPHIGLTGLMTVGPLTDDPEIIRAAFARCRKLFRQCRDLAGDQFGTLSMGMSADFPLAIAEGSTMIRIGTQIFGARESR